MPPQPTASAPPADPDLASVRWNLDPLTDGEGARGVERLLDEADERAAAFAEARQGRVKEIDGPGLATAMEELAAITALVHRAGAYAGLRFATDTADAERGALMARVQERGTAIETKLLFFELEWASLCDEHAEALLAADGLERCRHHLETLRRYRPHLLSEPEERVMTEKAVSGRNAWGRLFSELTSAIEVSVQDEPEAAPLDSALARLSSADRDERRRVAEAVSAALEPGVRTRVYIYNTLLADKATDDRLRAYPTWLSSRNLANEASDESVAALISAVRARFDIPQRWYGIKARVLGLERLADYDRAAAVTGEDDHVPWAQARDLVLDAYTAFSPELGSVAERFFAEDRVDAPPAPGKRGGAFCASTTPDTPTYLMLNYAGRRRDVLTLAHELGHGVHFELAAPRGILEQSTPLTVAETASVFGETIVFGRLLESAATPQSRFSLLAGAIDDAVATVFRQVAMSRFEALVHGERRERGELAPERFGELWAESQAELFGDSVEITDGYRLWWSYVPHFISTPGYVYAYAYGLLLALSVYARYLEEGEAFVPRYLELLAAGGSRSPEDLGRIAGVDLADPGFWDAGLTLVADRLDAAETAAREAGRLDQAATRRP